MAVIVVAIPLINSRKNRLLRERADAEHLQIASWAENDGWKVTDGTDPFVNDDAERVTGLTGTPGDWSIRVGEGAFTSSGPSGEDFSPMKRWVYGTILRRATPAGELMVLGAWYEGESQHWIFASMPTNGTFEPVLVDFMGPKQEPYVQGPMPTGEDGTAPDLSTMLHGLDTPCRLRLIGDKVLIRAPGWIDKASVDDIVERLRRADQTLPRRPGLGPQR